jgi:hypothetical protein
MLFSRWETRLEQFLVGPQLYVDRRVAIQNWLIALFLGGGFYGAVMGSYGERFLQVIYSAVKVPLLLLATTLIATPSFFVLNSLLGLREDFGRAFRAVLGTQATIAVLLASLAPYTLLWYSSFADYHEASAFNGCMFLIASLSAQWMLRRRYAELEARNSRHRAMRRTWVFLYAFVGIQMGWVLRPFIGDPARSPTFFRPDGWGNAYVIVCEIFWRVLLT